MSIAMRVAIVALALLSSGCVSAVRKPFATPVALAGGERVPLSVTLDLTSIRTDPLPGSSPYSAPTRALIADALAENVEHVARSSFVEVEVEPDPQATRPVLRPRVTAFEVGMGGAGSTVDLYTIVLEWSLTRPNGDLIWVETVSHTSSVQRTTVERVMRGSYAAVTRSPELRGLAARAP